MSYELKEKFRPPSEALYLTEPFRAHIELSTLHLYEPWLNMLPGGEGQPVLVIPGFTASDRSTAILRHFLSELGYLPCGWKQGVNFGVRHDLVVGVAELLHELYEQYQSRVSIIGQSLGGLYGREIAKIMPEAVRQVITLGSPVNDPDGVASRVSDLYKLFNPEHLTKSQQIKTEEWQLHVPPPVPTTSIYSKFDGVCHWRACLQRGDHDQIENIEVISSHTGMATNAQTLFVIADRLTQRRQTWKPFHVGSYFGLN